MQFGLREVKMENRKNPISQMVEDLDRSTEWLDPKKLDEKIDEIHEQLDLEQADNFIRAIAAIESAWLKDELVDTQVLQLHSKIKVLMEERLSEKTKNYIETIDNTLSRFLSLSIMMGLDKREIPNPYTELLSGKLKIPDYNQLLKCGRLGHDRLILVPPWSSKMMADHFPEDINIVNDIADFILNTTEPDNFYMIATRFAVSNYTTATLSEIPGVELPIDLLERNVKTWQEELLTDENLRLEGLSIREYLYFQLDGFQQANAGFKEFRNRSIRDLGKSCILFGEKSCPYHCVISARGLTDGVWLREENKIEAKNQEYQTRLAIHFDQDDGKIIDEEKK